MQRLSVTSGTPARRVLMVCFSRLAPADQGNARRIQQLTRLYRQWNFEVDLLYHQEEGHDVGLSVALRVQFGRVVVMPSRASRRIGRNHQATISDWYDPALERAALEMHAVRDYSVLHLNYVWYAPLFRRFDRRVCKVLDSHDVFADRAQKHLAAGMPPAWFSTTVEEEDAAFKAADVVLSIQRDEAQHMRQRGHRHVLYLPWIEPFDAPFAPRHPQASPLTPAEGQVPQAPLRIGYLGSGNMWNVRSLVLFSEALAKRLGGRPLPFQLVIAGGLSRHAPAMPGVVALGFVGNLRSFYSSIDLALNPMVGGTGLKIKTVEPLAFGCPVLATEAGVQGLTHVWQSPVMPSPDALAAFLLEQVASAPRDWLVQLREQSRQSRELFEAEHDQQVDRFGGWLLQSLEKRGLESRLQARSNPVTGFA